MGGLVEFVDLIEGFSCQSLCQFVPDNLLGVAGFYFSDLWEFVGGDFTQVEDLDPGFRIDVIELKLNKT